MLSRHLGRRNWQRVGASQKNNFKGPADGLKEGRGRTGGPSPLARPYSLIFVFAFKMATAIDILYLWPFR